MHVRWLLWVVPMMLAASGCLQAATDAAVSDDDDHCDEIQRLRDGAWFLPTVRATSPEPSWSVHARSDLDRLWWDQHRLSGCRTAVPVLEGEPMPQQPWVGPVMRSGEMDEIVVTFTNRMQEPVRAVAWANVTGSAVRVEPAKFEGLAPTGVSVVRLLVRAVEPGSAEVDVRVSTDRYGTGSVGGGGFVVDDNAGPPHRVE